MNEQDFDKYKCISLINKTKDELFKDMSDYGCKSNIYKEHYDNDNN